MTTETTPDTRTMYDRIGGAITVRRVAYSLYAWIRDDDILFLTYFKDVDMIKLRGHMAVLLSQVLGGPKAYTGRDMANAHAGLGITAAHFDRVVDYLLAALHLEHAPADVIEAVRQVAEGARPDIVTASA
jgi:hemoglobin